MDWLIGWMTLDEWILVLILIVIVFGIGWMPAIARRLAGRRSDRDASGA